MLDRLPPEILDDILLLAATPFHDGKVSVGSKATLKRCCLVSRTLYSRAQRLLWGDIVLRGLNGVLSCEIWRFASLLSLDIGKSREGVKERPGGALPRPLGLVRTFRFEKYGFRTTQQVAVLFAVLALLPSSVQQVHLEMNLSTLICANQRIVGDSPSLTSLTILSLTEARATSPTFTALFSSATLPSLRVLVFDRLHRTHMEGIGDDPFSALTPSFLSQLDVLQLGTDDFIHFPADLFPHPFALVVDWISLKCLEIILSRVQRLQL
ncbi:hypothetical protein JCM6882_000627 [Rhodosporidiobolus microsporus]